MKGMVSKSRFEEVEFMSPPFDQQRLFGEVFLRIHELRTAHETSLTHLDALFASLQHRAFRGK